MTKILKHVLQQAGFTETVKPKRERYQILHIPTASYIYEYNMDKDNIKLVIARNKADAGKIRDLFRTGAIVRKSYSGHIVPCFYLIQEDLDTLPNNSNSFAYWYKVRTHLAIRKLELQQTPMSVMEFDLIIYQE